MCTLRRQQARVDRLRTQELKLLHLFYRDKITDELFEQEQTRIAGELSEARRTLAAVQNEYAERQRIVELALDLARDCQPAYQLADPPTRRLFNQVFFTKIFVDAVDATAPSVAGEPRCTYRTGTTGAGNRHGSSQDRRRSGPLIDVVRQTGRSARRCEDRPAGD